MVYDRIACLRNASETSLIYSQWGLGQDFSEVFLEAHSLPDPLLQKPLLNSHLDLRLVTVIAFGFYLFICNGKHAFKVLANKIGKVTAI